MNADRLVSEMPEGTASAPAPAFPTAFVVVTFAVAIAVGAVIAYLGIKGMIGAGIP